MSTTALMTFADFEQLPEEPGKRELIDGEVITMPPPEKSHSRVAKRVFRLFLDAVGEARAWHDHTGYRIGSGWIEPDVSVSWPDQQEDSKYLIGAPMVAVEILSPGEEIERKLSLYFDDRAFEVWLLDPKRRTMTVYLRRGGEIIRQAVTNAYRSEAIGITVSLDQLFGS